MFYRKQQSITKKGEEGGEEEEEDSEEDSEEEEEEEEGGKGESSSSSSEEEGEDMYDYQYLLEDYKEMENINNITDETATNSDNQSDSSVLLKKPAKGTDVIDLSKRSKRDSYPEKGGNITADNTTSANLPVANEILDTTEDEQDREMKKTNANINIKEDILNGETQDQQEVAKQEVDEQEVDEQQEKLDLNHQDPGENNNEDDDDDDETEYDKGFVELMTPNEELKPTEEDAIKDAMYTFKAHERTEKKYLDYADFLPILSEDSVMLTYRGVKSMRRRWTHIVLVCDFSKQQTDDATFQLVAARGLNMVSSIVSIHFCR